MHFSDSSVACHLVCCHEGHVADQERLKTLFEAKVKNFESKVPQRFQTLHPLKEGIADLRSKRASFRTIADLLNQLGVKVSHNTVARFCAEILASPRRQSRTTVIEPAGRESRRETTAARASHFVIIHPLRKPTPRPSHRRSQERLTP